MNDADRVPTNADAVALQTVLRSLAEARDSSFSSLLRDIQSRQVQRSPQIGFRIYQVADSVDVLVVVGVEATRTDGIDVCWSVSFTASPHLIVVVGSIEVGDETGFRDVFETRSETPRADVAQLAIKQAAAEVCAQVGWISDEIPPRW